MEQQGFDISKYITAADIVSAVTAGTIAYLTYKTKQEEPKPEQPQQGQQPQAAQPRGQAPAAQPQAQPQAPAVPKKEPGWMKYCDDPSDPNEVAAARLQYKAEQLSNATGGAPSATGTFQGGRLTSATPTAATAPSATSPTSGPIQQAMTAIENRPQFSGDLHLPSSSRDMIGSYTLNKIRPTGTMAPVVRLSITKDLQLAGFNAHDAGDIAEELREYGFSNMMEIRKVMNTMGTSGLRQLIKSPDKWDLIHTASMIAGVEG